MRKTGVIISLFSAFFLLAQNKKIDSLIAVINKTTIDTVKFNCYSTLCILYERKQDYVNQKVTCDSMLSIAGRTKLKKHLAKTYNYYADYYAATGDYLTSIKFNYKAIKVFEELKNEYGVLRTYISMGIVYYYLRDIKKAHELFKKSLNGYKINNFNDKNDLANLYNNLGSSAAELGEFNSARNYFLDGLKCFEELKDSISMAYSYNNLGLIFKELKQKDSALIFLNKALRMKIKFGSNAEKQSGYNELGEYYYALGENKKALLNFQSAAALIDTTNVMEKDINVWYNISNAYKKANDFQKALLYLNYCYQFNSRSNEANIKTTLSQLEDGFMSAKKQYADSLLQVSKSQIQQLQISQQGEQLRSEKRQRVLLLIGLGIVLAGIVLFYNRYKITKKQKEIIEEQKELVDEKNKQITHQKDLLEEKQKEVIDSINYAQRIQNAVLTNEKVWQKISPQHFILFQPKDIVSGDFYWAYNTPNNRSIWAVADCTGHGVPGAFMSMLGNSILNQIVVEGKIFKASEILNKLREKIIEALEQKGVSQNDGMDISLCVWNKLNHTLEFSGANNSIVISRNEELIELKADKMPIGKPHGDIIPFTDQQFSLQNNDVIYMYSDGYADQFGGPKGKKFRYKELDGLLLKNAKLPMEMQYSSLLDTFLTWKGGLIQTDDVCIIGIKVLT